MSFGIIGLGKMGLQLALNAQAHGLSPTVYDITPAACEAARTQGLSVAASLEELAGRLAAPRVLWFMVPAGDAVDQLIARLVPLLSENDLLVDGGNSRWQDSMRRARELTEKGIAFADAGTSGGVSGARNGICAMVGATPEVFRMLEPLLRPLCVTGGLLHAGPPGCGHYVKMVHNGIEYGMMQAIGEGFELMRKSGLPLDLAAVADVWTHGSVIRGWLMELTASLLGEDPSLENLQGVIHSSGEGLWTLEEALRLKVSVPVIAQSLFVRYQSESGEAFSNKVVAGLRNQFGGHAVERATDERKENRGKAGSDSDHAGGQHADVLEGGRHESPS